MNRAHSLKRLPRFQITVLLLAVLYVLVIVGVLLSTTVTPTQAEYYRPPAPWPMTIWSP